MENFQVYRDIQARTGGDIYIGVVGPVRTGKSTFIRRFMELVALPDMEPAKHYIIRVASDDLLYVEGEKDALVEKAGITGTIEVQEELKRLLNKFCDCLDEQTEILKKERKEKSDA